MSVQPRPHAVPARLDRSTLSLVGVLAAAAFMAVLDGTVVSVALVDLAQVFGTDIEAIAWVTVSYLLAAGIAMPLSGWAVDRFGGRRTFLVGLALFVAGSLLSALSWSAAALIAFRVLQGLGGGLLEPTALTLAARAAPAGRTGRVLGFLSLIINVAPVAGPLIGGLLAGSGHWTWIFLLNLPLGAVILAGVLAWVRAEPSAESPGRPDVLGMALLPIGFVAVLFAVDRFGGGAPVWIWGPSLAVGVTLLGGYVRHALVVERPVLDLRLLRFRPYVVSLATMSLVGFTMYSQLVVLPLIARDRYGLTGIAQGLLVTGLGVGLLVSMSTAGRVSDRTGPRPLVRGGAIVTGIGLVLAVTLGLSLPAPALAAVFVVVGLGFGAVASPTFASVYRTVPGDAAAQATTTMFISVQLSASLGVTVVGLIAGRHETMLWILVAATVLMIAVSRWLPGRPALRTGR